MQSRLLTCAAGVVDAPVSDRSSYVYSSSWGGVYVIAGFTECSRRKLLARADDVRYNIYISRHRGPAVHVRLGWLAPARQSRHRGPAVRLAPARRVATSVDNAHAHGLSLRNTELRGESKTNNGLCKSSHDNAHHRSAYRHSVRSSCSDSSHWCCRCSRLCSY